ncbi:uncharacterized protein C3orf85-like [Takifugu flavidus]|nr:uncharacterized protein C3orf85-like [Takifugu flavidus]
MRPLAHGRAGCDGSACLFISRPTVCERGSCSGSHSRQRFQRRSSTQQIHSHAAEMRSVLLFVLVSGVLAAPFVKEKEAKTFIRLKRQSGYWDPYHSQNMWGYTVQEQANEYWTALRTNAQYYIDLNNLMFDRSVATENNRMYMEMLRNAQAHLDSQTGGHR